MSVRFSTSSNILSFRFARNYSEMFGNRERVTVAYWNKFVSRTHIRDFVLEIVTFNCSYQIFYFEGQKVEQRNTIENFRKSEPPMRVPSGRHHFETPP